MRDVYPFLETHDLKAGFGMNMTGDIDPAQLDSGLWVKRARVRPALKSSVFVR